MEEEFSRTKFSIGKALTCSPSLKTINLRDLKLLPFSLLEWGMWEIILQRTTKESGKAVIEPRL
jgi:hypothetical protein